MDLDFETRRREQALDRLMSVLAPASLEVLREATAKAPDKDRPTRLEAKLDEFFLTSE